MVTIRLMRRGGKKEPFYHVVVTDHWVGCGAKPTERVAQLLKSYRKAQPAAA